MLFRRLHLVKTLYKSAHKVIIHFYLRILDVGKTPTDFVIDLDNIKIHRTYR